MNPHEAAFLTQDVMVFAAAARHGAPVDQTSLVRSRGVSMPLRRPPAASAAAASRAEYDVRRQGLRYAGRDQRVDGVSERAITGIYLNGLQRLRLGPLSEVLATNNIDIDVEQKMPDFSFTQHTWSRASDVASRSITRQRKRVAATRPQCTTRGPSPSAA